VTGLIRLPDNGEPPRLFLQNSQVPRIRYPLLPAGTLKQFGEGYASAEMTVPASTPPGLYDMVLLAQKREVINRRSVSVVSSYKTSFRFVHLSNMNIGDPTAIDFDPQLPEEVNLLAPEFIVATGDYTEWARLCDRPTDWQRVLDYMACFDAPVYLVCGDHDHEASFTRLVANSPIGTIDYGKVHGLLLLDHGNHPIAQDPDQVRWVIQDLEANRDGALNFVVTHSDELGLLRQLRDMHMAEKVVHDFKLRMIICGGQADWDYREFASLLNGLPGLQYIRTGQSSTAVRDKATGQSHYRVIEVNNERISCVYPADYFDTRAQYSVPAGRMRVTFGNTNDGSQDQVTVNVANGLNRPWGDCRIWLRIRKDDTASRPAVAGGTLLQCLDAGRYWACLVAFDLPDKGAVMLQAGTAERLAARSPVRLEFNAAGQLGFVPRDAGNGLACFTCANPATLKLTNTSAQAVQSWPIVRLNGASLALSGPGPQSLPIALAPMSTEVLRINLTLGQMAPGPHMLQAYLLEDPLRRLTTQQVILLLSGEPLQGPQFASGPGASDASTPATATQPITGPPQSGP
jgi:predicted MPP superfamily phosphohydrolase